ncbi:MAG: hypothetical protein J5767_13070 [Paludibacteraceae bacterium]|nr:hypothetical protein [Paludibacteraceae bacterium]
MAKRKTTQHWDEIKSQYTNCLCYSDEKGLYTMRVSENENPDELLYRPQGYVGFVNDIIVIPDQGVEIEIQSNFGYASASYLRATIKRNNRTILDFDLSKIYVLRNCGVNTFDVPLYDWDKLFEKIINAYKASFIEEYTTASIAYLEELSDMLDMDKITIKGEFGKEKSTEWKGGFLVTLFAGNKIRNLLKGFKEAKISDPVVVKYTLNLCRKYMCKINSFELDNSDSRISQVSETLLLIHQFMNDNNAGIEYLSLLLGKEV